MDTVSEPGNVLLASEQCQCQGSHAADMRDTVAHSVSPVSLPSPLLAVSVKLNLNGQTDVSPFRWSLALMTANVAVWFASNVCDPFTSVTGTNALLLMLCCRRDRCATSVVR